MGSAKSLKRASTLIKLSEEPIGWYSPTFFQAAIIRFARAFGLGNGAIRNYGALAVINLRSAPVDYDYHGLLLRFYPAHYASARHMLFTPEWSEKHERNFIFEHLPSDGVFIDVGANAGFFLFAVAARYPKCRVLGFEPIADYAAILNYNIRVNELTNVAVEPVALSDGEGEVVMHRETQSMMYGDDIITVPSARLDQVLSRRGLERIDVLKIDVEGVEDRVLLPFFRSVERALWPKAVIIEDSCQQYWQEDCIAFMKANGYSEVYRSALNVGLVQQAA